MAKHKCPGCNQICESVVEGPYEQFKATSADGDPTSIDLLVELNKQDRGRRGWRPFVESITFEAGEFEFITDDISNRGQLIPKRVGFQAFFVDLPTQPVAPAPGTLTFQAFNERYWLASLPSDIWGADTPVKPPHVRGVLFKGFVSWASMLTDGSSPGIPVPHVGVGKGYKDVWVNTFFDTDVRLSATVNIRWLNCGCNS